MGIRRLLRAVVGRWRPDQNQIYDRQTAAVMRRVLAPDSNTVDAGCHAGVFLRQLLALAPRGVHYGFEPIPRLYDALRHSFAGVGAVRLHDCALSDAAGTTTFQHVVSNPGFSGLRLRRYDRDEPVEEIAVRTARLDDIVPPTLPIRFVKVDVEGAELQVFRGAFETIRRDRPTIVFEHGIGGADYFGTTPDQVYDLLVEECGLTLFLMADWLRTDGRMALDRPAFRGQFTRNENYYFLAAPEPGGRG